MFRIQSNDIIILFVCGEKKAFSIPTGIHTREEAVNNIMTTSFVNFIYFFTNDVL